MFLGISQKQINITLMLYTLWQLLETHTWAAFQNLLSGLAFLYQYLSLVHYKASKKNKAARVSAFQELKRLFREREMTYYDLPIQHIYLFKINMKVLQPGNFETGTSSYNFLGKEFYLKNKVPFFILDPFFFRWPLTKPLKIVAFRREFQKKTNPKQRENNK